MLCAVVLVTAVQKRERERESAICVTDKESRKNYHSVNTYHVKPLPNMSNPANNCSEGGWSISIIKRKPGLIYMLNLLKATQVKSSRMSTKLILLQDSGTCIL